MTRRTPRDSAADPRGAALRAEVLARPDDAGVRLVYADYLAERGGVFADAIAHPADDGARLACAALLDAAQDPLGEMIRVEVALERADTAALAAGDRHRLWGRRRDLRDTCGARLAEAALGIPHVIRRGLVDEIAVTPTKLSRFGARLFAANPIQRVAILVGPEPRLAALGRLAAHLPPTVTHVALVGRGERRPRVTLGDAASATALFAQRTVGFANLDTAWGPPLEVVAAAGARGLHFERIDRLPPIAHARPLFATLATIETERTPWPGLTAALIADGAPHLQRIEALIVDDEVLDLLAAAPTQLPALRELELWHFANALDAQGFVRLVKLLAASPVRRIITSHTDQRLLAAAAALPNVELVRRTRGEVAELGSFLVPYS